MHSYNLQKNMKRNCGFSLIELMVSLTIFSIVMTVSVGTLLVLIDANAKAQALSSAMTNLSFAIDSMTRNIRTGKDYYCDGASSLGNPLKSLKNDCSGETGIVFTPGFENNKRMAYRHNGTAIQQRKDTGGVADSWVDITSTLPPAAVQITRLQFTVEGSSNGDTNQPKITMFIEGQVDNGLTSPSKFKIQSNVTQRVLDY